MTHDAYERLKQVMMGDRADADIQDVRDMCAAYSAVVREIQTLRSLCDPTVAEHFRTERYRMIREVATLEIALREACDLYDAAECVGPTRPEQARIAELRKLLT